jgi:signal transduction histidine kinase
MLSRAIANVLGNAIKFSPPHTHVHCTLNARATSWVIAVSDQGPGIDAQQQSQLFTPFQRQHQRSHPGIAGTGLGLAFTYTVMQRHAGRIEVQSTLGAGTEFRLVLPQCAPAHLGDE